MILVEMRDSIHEFPSFLLLFVFIAFLTLFPLIKVATFALEFTWTTTRSIATLKDLMGCYPVAMLPSEASHWRHPFIHLGEEKQFGAHFLV